MHPAPSIIFFTAISGLGFGFLIFLGLGFYVPTGLAAFATFALAYLLTVGGLISSTFHLGHPERALKSFSQWRSSWLSREGWLAVLTLVVMALYGAGLVFAGTQWVVLGYIGAALALMAVIATSMIYAQLKTVPRWNQWTTPPLFILFALTGGAMLTGQTTLSLALLIVLALLQGIAWLHGDGRFDHVSMGLGSATGLGNRGAVRAFEPPHTGTNYLMKEMIHVVGRKHAIKLRIIGLGLGMVLPVLILALLPSSSITMIFALLVHISGLLTMRWLFFAEAEHVVGLYYGKR